MMSNKLKVGQKIKFKEEVQRYTVKASSSRYLICTKPFNARRTTLYTIVDLKEGVRGTENLIFGMGAETEEQCQEMLARLESGESEISHRNNIPLLIDKSVRNESRIDHLKPPPKHITAATLDYVLGSQIR